MQKDRYGNLQCPEHRQNDCNPRCLAFEEEYYKLFKHPKCGGQLEFKDKDGNFALKGILQPHTCPKDVK